TDHFKQSSCRLVLTFEGTPKPLPESPAIISDVAVGHRRELVIAYYSDEHRQPAEPLNPMSTEAVHMTLQGAFIEYPRGRKRVMPNLSEPKTEQKSKNQVPVS